MTAIQLTCTSDDRHVVSYDLAFEARVADIRCVKCGAPTVITGPPLP